MNKKAPKTGALIFNSNMVRLKAISVIYSAIKKNFQFQHGTIKRHAQTPIIHAQVFFNSNMVRLKECLM